MNHKRKRENSVDRMRKKIRRLEKKLERRQPTLSSSSLSSDSSSVDEERNHASDQEIQSGDSDFEIEPPVRAVPAATQMHDSPVRSARRSPPSSPVRPLTPPPSPTTAPAPLDKDAASDPDPAVTIAPDILEALGDAKTKEVPFGQKILEEVSKRWGRILTDGLSKEHKQELINKTLIPENFQLLKAPLLNQEISAVLTDSSRNRDKRLEKAQNQLGIGLAGITTLMSTLIESKEIESVDMVKRLSEIGQILLDLHYENSTNRIKLITPVLDKKFLTMIHDVKRDSYLFGKDLGGTIKATKTAERSGLQIKKPAASTTASSSKKFTPATSWRGPPRQQGQRYGGRPNSNRTRSGGGAPPAPRRAAQAPAERYHTSASAARPTRNTRK